MNTDTKQQSEAVQAFELHALAVSAREENKLTGVQEYAKDLYKRGFNVFPIPTAHDWNLRGEEKKPYILEPLFRNHLHYVEGCQCLTCYKFNFFTLFENSNIAIMCGATSGNLLSVDCDSQESFKFIGDELARRGLVFPHVWAFKSGRGGGHYLLRVIEGEAANISQKQSKFEDVQVWASRHFVIVPPSIHPNGTMYQWQTPEPLTMLPRETLPAVNVTALEWLGVTLKKYRKSENEDDIDGLPEYAKNLSHASRDTLKHGAKDGGRNGALWNLSCDLVGIGLDEDEAETALQMAADNCEPPYPSDKTDTPIQTILEYAFSEERGPSRSYQSRKKTGGAVQEWQRAQAFAMAYDWRGNFGGKSSCARRVYHACIERARLDSRSKVFRAAVREVSKHTGLRTDRVSRYLRVFTGRNTDYKGRPLFKKSPAEPLLEWHGKEASGAYKFAFAFGVNAIPAQYKDIDILLCGNCTTENNTLPFTDAEANAFHGLGAYAFKVWRDICVRPAKSLYEIAKRLSVSPHTVKDTVTRLVSAGLVVFSQSEGLYIGNQLTDAQLAIIAADRGTQNKAQEKRQRFTLEREKHANKLVFEAKDWYKRQDVTGGKRFTSHPQAEPAKTNTKPTQAEMQPKTEAQPVNNSGEWHVWNGREEDGVYLEFRENNGRAECRNIDYAEFKRQQNKKLEEGKKRAYELVSKFSKNKAAEIASRPEPVEAAYKFLEWLANKGNKEAAELVRREVGNKDRTLANEERI